MTNTKKQIDWNFENKVEKQIAILDQLLFDQKENVKELKLVNRLIDQRLLVKLRHFFTLQRSVLKTILRKAHQSMSETIRRMEKISENAVESSNMEQVKKIRKELA